MKFKKLENCFDKDGNFIIPGFDPYRVPDDDKDKQSLRDFLFDEDGYAKWSSEMFDLIEKKKWAWNSSAVLYYYSGVCIDCNCKGNYTAIYAWRH